jgi:hypothetical protein
LEALPPDEPDGYQTRTTSPDGDYVWIVDPSEALPTQWVLAGALWRKQPPSRLFVPPWDWNFEARAWTSPLCSRMGGRRFPGVMPGITLTLEPDTGRGTIVVDTGDKRRSRSQVPAAPSAAQPFAVLLAWLAAYPKR